MFCDSNKDAVFRSSIPRDVLNKVAKLADRMKKGYARSFEKSPSQERDAASPSGEKAEAWYRLLSKKTKKKDKKKKKTYMKQDT